MTLLPIDKYILRALKVPNIDVRKIIKSIDVYTNEDASEIERLPSRMSIRSVFAWSFLMTYRDAPLLIVGGIFAIVFVIPLIIFVRLFSLGNYGCKY